MSSPVARSYKTYLSMAENDEAETATTERLRFKDEEEAAGGSHHGGRASMAANRRPQLARSSTAFSEDSISIRPASRREPTIALPIQYRTLSIDLEDAKAKNKNNAVTDLADLDWHTIPTHEVTQRLNVSERHGLSDEQVKRRLQKYGKNAPSPPQTHRFKTIMGYFFKGFGSVLLVASILVFIAWRPLGDPPAQANLALAIVLLAVFFIQAGFNMWQDWSSSRVMNSIKTMLPDECHVVRDGAQMSLFAAELVPGDVLLVKAGNKLPADVRFINVSSDTKFDRSILTGESVPLAAVVDSTDTNYLETRNIGLQGTHCVSGSCTGIVVSTGNKTVFGRIAKLTNEPKVGLTTLEKEVLSFVWIICSIMLVMIIIVIVLWAAWLRTTYPDWINVPTLIVDCVSVAVAFIPEGLPVALTASLTISANMMRKNKILCKSLKTVETLGAVSVICSDKTGTLTANKMVVTDCFVGLEKMTADNVRDTLIAERNTDGNFAGNAIDQLRTIGGLCNAAVFDAQTRKLPLAERKIHGDATDTAILRFSEGLGHISELKRCWHTKFDLAFNSKNKFMIRVLSLAHPDGKTDAMPLDVASVFEPSDLLLTIKGAPDRLLDRCKYYIGRTGASHLMTETAKAQIEATQAEYSARGRRVLLLAHKTLSRSSIKASTISSTFEKEMTDNAKSGLTFVGLVAIQDPPRPEIPDVIQTLRGAGIRIFMVTGDFALTAQAIAAECGIITNSPGLVKSAADLNRNPLAHPSDLNGEGHVAKNVRFDDQHQPTSIVVTGSDLMAMNESQWDQLIMSYTEVVFARTTPEQKLRIVRELQARNMVVGMTGDGVNDAPALRAADVGIAVGSGSDIAVEAADMVLLESFSSVVEAVRYGRMMFDNLKKTIAYLLPAGSFSEFWPVFTNVAFGLPQVLSSFLMIVICCFTDCLAATSLAYEKPEADVLLRPPRVVGVDRLVDWKLIVQSYGFIGIMETTASFAMSYWYLERNGIPFSRLWFGFGDPQGIDADYYTQKLSVASSVYFITLVVMQWFNLMSVRTRRLSIFQHPPLFNRKTQNVWLFPAILFALVMAFFWLYIPRLQEVLSTAPVPVEYWFLPMTFGLAILLLDEGRKFFVRKWPSGLMARWAW
ncbi:hypothetical protein N8I77_008697 [Diaporthe amygdali]|uniref:Cation-transporting P-type ATPase N-terminal domain-containing protein n=1 Tax=Phomopsis amygdali TaxID=1214568 RepID=A0AAD9S9U3_PHOAM|nr:hypothetical protein N8I77_008697 [Diaporthe amygdali]